MCNEQAPRRPLSPTFSKSAKRKFQTPSERYSLTFADSSPSNQLVVVEICRLRRKPDHFQAFLLAELGTSGSIDGNQTLIIRGRYQPKQIESVVRSYIKEYVLCHTCKSPQTKLVKDTRLFFLQCDACSSRCSVVSVKSGYQAVTGKRAALRAKTGT